MPEQPTNAAPDPLADADAAAASALARAEAARAHAAELRRKVETLTALPADVDAQSDLAPQPTATITTARRLPRPKARWTFAAAAALLLCALLCASGYITQQHRGTEQDRQHAAEYAAAARQGVVNLMAINFNTAEADVQRVLDNSTGAFKTQFQDGSRDLIPALKEAKVITEVNVNSAAVESMSSDGAVVLVAATSLRGDADAANRDPRTWRAVVTIARESGQLKVSQLDFV